MYLKYRKPIILAFILWAILSAAFLPNLKFSFDFEQFFPQGDPDLEYFKNFIDEFETDDNFLMIAIKNRPTVFDSVFLEKFHKYSLGLRKMPYVESVQSLTMLRAPVKTPFGVSTVPVIHRNKPALYFQDKDLILSDPRYVNNLINEDATALIAFIKNKDAIQIRESTRMMDSIHAYNAKFGWDKMHMLGRADLQKELVYMQKIEITRTVILSGILVSIVLFLLYRRPIGVLISLVSIGLGLLNFVGLMAILGREFNAMSALYPVLLLIVGTSDVIHIQSKYIDELRKGKNKFDAMELTIKQIGLATLLTSITTSIGFATLLTSKVQPIREFGINAAIGVMLAYVTVIFFTTCLMTYFPKEKISKYVNQESIWDGFLRRFYKYSLDRPAQIAMASLLLFMVFAYGISIITTNYRIEQNLPRGARVTNDFRFFEEEFAGFRPLEFAIIPNSQKADTYDVLKEVDKLNQHLQSMDVIKSSISIPTFYRSIERMNNGNAISAYRFPETREAFDKARKMLERSKMADHAVLLNDDRSKTRISGRISDVGADSIKAIGQRLDQWINNNIDTSLVSIKRTGTGVILDKNAVYIRDNILWGLAIAILAVSLLMGLLFRSMKMLFIALVPNVFPLLLAGAIIGYLGIELEAGVSVVFAIIFGIAVDDTIHFLSKFKLAKNAGKNTEEALQVTFSETGKAIVFTTIILFFGFLLMVFSSHPPSVTIGLLISATLVGALICDLTILPILIRKFMN